MTQWLFIQSFSHSIIQSFLMKNSRREFLKKSALTGLAGIAIPSLFIGEDASATTTAATATTTVFELPPLPYAYDALEPHLDNMTMEIHHDKHHKAYVDNLNKAVNEHNITASLDEIIAKVSKY